MTDNKVLATSKIKKTNQERAQKRMVPCPSCRQATPFEGNPFRPFCSERCKMVDLGAWANEEYRVESKEESVSTSQGNGES